MHMAKGKEDGKGAFYYQFHNYKRKFTEIAIDDEESGNDKEIKKKKKNAGDEISLLPLNEIDDAEHKRKLKFDNLSMDEKMEHWRGCVASRLNNIRSNGSETVQMAKFYKEWNPYTTPTGYLFVRIAFALV